MHGSASFPGIQKIASATYTLTHGVSPGRAQLTVAPGQRGIQIKTGALVFRFGNEVVSLPDFTVDEASEVRDPNGFLMSVALVDKRRKWGWGQVSGRYNLRDRRTGTIRAGTEKSPAQLATLCLEAMGEKNIDVAAMPPQPRPEIEWDFATPAAALTELCADVGCRVTLQIDGKVKIVKLGEGNPLPKGGRAADSRTENPHESPSTVVVVGAPSLVQADLALEAVGLEPDGEIRVIDSLSYKPAAGWSATPAEEFASETDDKKKETYKQSVYRMYRIKVGSGYGKVPGYGQLVSLDQILPISDRQVDTTKDGNGNIVAAPAEVWGSWYDEQEMNGNTESLLETHAKAAKQSFYKRPFSIDRERGIVVFSQPVYRLSTGSTPTVEAAKLCLRVGVSVRDSKTRAWLRYQVKRNMGTREVTPPRYIYRPELIFAVTATYNKVDPPAFGALHTNEVKIKALANRFLDREQNILAKIAKSEGAVYPGIKKINPDGFIQAVGWSVSSQSPTVTRADANFDPGAIPEVDLGFVQAQHNMGIAYVEWENWRHLAQRIGEVAGAP